MIILKVLQVANPQDILIFSKSARKGRSEGKVNSLMLAIYLALIV